MSQLHIVDLLRSCMKNYNYGLYLVKKILFFIILKNVDVVNEISHENLTSDNDHN